MTAIDLYNLLTPKEKEELLKLLQDTAPSPCQRVGHKYKVISSTKGGWLFPATSKSMCTQCGRTLISKG